MGERSFQKEAYWRGMLARQRKRGVSIRQFCFDQGLSEASFYSWRREIARRDRQAGAARTRQAVQEGVGRTSPLVPHAGNRREAGNGMRNRSTDGGATRPAGPPRFIPLQVVAAAAGVIEVVHPRGHVVRVPAGFDAGSLRQVLELLDRERSG